MNEILKMAKEYQEKLPREIMAHRVSAEYHRHWHMALGALATVVTAIVGTAIFTGLVSQLGLDGQGELRNPFAGGGMDFPLYVIVIVLSISAPVLAALHTFMHHADDASTHRASMRGYAEVHRRLTSFVARYVDSNQAAQQKDEFLKEYDEIIKAYDSVLGNSLTLTRKAYNVADELMKEAVTNHKA